MRKTIRGNQWEEGDGQESHGAEYCLSIEYKSYEKQTKLSRC
jgi:hypothetical protein